MRGLTIGGLMSYTVMGYRGDEWCGTHRGVSGSSLQRVKEGLHGMATHVVVTDDATGRVIADYASPNTDPLILESLARCEHLRTAHG